jgi:hypothetical protein
MDEFDTNNAKVRNDLLNEGAKHITFLSRWAGTMPVSVVGVNLLDACMYDIVQVLNGAFLQDYVTKNTTTKEKAESEQVTNA